MERKYFVLKGYINNDKNKDIGIVLGELIGYLILLYSIPDTLVIIYYQPFSCLVLVCEQHLYINF